MIYSEIVEKGSIKKLSKNGFQIQPTIDNLEKGIGLVLFFRLIFKVVGLFRQLQQKA